MTGSADRSLLSLCGAIADELRGLGALAEAVAVSLIADEQLAGRAVEHLQSFDLLAQSARESADLLSGLTSGQPPHDAVEQVRLERLQERLRAALRA